MSTPQFFFWEAIFFVSIPKPANQNGVSGRPGLSFDDLRCHPIGPFRHGSSMAGTGTEDIGKVVPKKESF